MRAAAPTVSCRQTVPAGAALTPAQRGFAAIHHDLIYAFLHSRNHAVSEYYDLAALGYLAAVRRYLTQMELKQYAFSTIAWHSMERSIAAFHRAELRRRDAERQYVQSMPRPPDPMEEMEARLTLHELASVSTPEQYRLAALRLHGYSIAETARLRGIPPQRAGRLLHKMYRVYLQLYKN